jgi:hypothetical protein
MFGEAFWLAGFDIVLPTSSQVLWLDASHEMNLSRVNMSITSRPEAIGCLGAGGTSEDEERFGL